MADNEKNEMKCKWVVTEERRLGERLFTFDGEKIFNLFRDYPHELTPEQKRIFDEENPYWANYFDYRNEEQ